MEGGQRPGRPGTPGRPTRREGCGAGAPLGLGSPHALATRGEEPGTRSRQPRGTEAEQDGQCGRRPARVPSRLSALESHLKARLGRGSWESSRLPGRPASPPHADQGRQRQVRGGATSGRGGGEGGDGKERSEGANQRSAASLGGWPRFVGTAQAPALKRCPEQNRQPLMLLVKGKEC